MVGESLISQMTEFTPRRGSGVTAGIFICSSPDLILHTVFDQVRLESPLVTSKRN